jgi:hypothetical protein
MIRNEVERLCCLNVLRRCNESEWAAPSFGTPKKNGQIRFVSDFRQLNKWIIRRPYPMPSIHELFKRFEGFTTVLPSISTWDSGQSFLISSRNVYARSSYLGENTVTFDFQWDSPVHRTYTKRRCQNCSST